MKTVAGRMEYRRRTLVMAVRQSGYDAITGEEMHVGDVTFDHQDGRGANGSHRDDRTEVKGEWRNAALTMESNGKKGSRRYHWKDGKYIPAVYSSPEQAE